MLWQSNKRARKSGQATVEFALVSVLLVLLLIGVADVARIFSEHLAVVHAAQVGARWTTLTGTQQYCSFPPSPGGALPNVATVVARDLGEPLAGQTVVVVVKTPAAPVAPAVSVEISYTHRFLFGLIDIDNRFSADASMPGVPATPQASANCPAPVTPGPLPTSTNTPVPTNTATNTPTYTPTNTPTRTPTGTATQTSTQTPTGTATQPPTNTPVSTATSVPTNTATNTPSPTGTPNPATQTAVAATQTAIVAGTQTSVAATQTAIVGATQTSVAATQTAIVAGTRTAVAATQTAIVAGTQTAVSATQTAVADFSITASPSAHTISRPGTGSSTITVTSLGGFSGTVNLSVAFTPAESKVQTTLSAPSVVVTPGTPGQATLNINVDNGAGLRTYVITITGTSGPKTHTTTVTLTVQN